MSGPRNGRSQSPMRASTTGGRPGIRVVGSNQDRDHPPQDATCSPRKVTPRRRGIQGPHVSAPPTRAVRSLPETRDSPRRCRAPSLHPRRQFSPVLRRGPRSAEGRRVVVDRCGVSVRRPTGLDSGGVDCSRPGVRPAHTSRRPGPTRGGGRTSLPTPDPLCPPIRDLPGPGPRRDPRGRVDSRPTSTASSTARGRRGGVGGTSTIVGP